MHLLRFLIPVVLIFSNRLMAEDSIQYTVMYFGATNCFHCLVEDHIENIKLIRSDFSGKYPKAKTKFVMVVFDNEIEAGLKFIDHYGFWDEISIGSRYNNEQSLAVLNHTKLPGLPHLVVLEDHFTTLPNNIEVVDNRKTLVDLVGRKEIGDWVTKGFPLQ
ncbi:MAG: hypothetical protein KDC80_26005 [Saprospiraceae bacterium]|nr:hypothetical protein [Saprospiraceae bacterium]